MYNKPNTPKTPQSLGGVQEAFRYKFSGKYQSFNSGDEFFITEDLPKNKPVRSEFKKMKGKDGGEFDSETKLIRVMCKGYEADMEIYAKDLPRLAVLCPKGIENFKGCTLVYDGNNWAYMGIEGNTTTSPIANIGQAMRDPRQPDLNAPTQQQDQKEIMVNKLISGIKAINMIGTDVFASDLLKMASKISPGNEVEMVGYAKARGLIHEEEGGVIKAN